MCGVSVVTAVKGSRQRIGTEKCVVAHRDDHECELSISRITSQWTFSQITGLLKNRLDASGVQLGRKVVVDGQEIVEFIIASEGREDMVGQVRNPSIVPIFAPPLTPSLTVER